MSSNQAGFLPVPQAGENDEKRLNHLRRVMVMVHLNTGYPSSKDLVTIYVRRAHADVQYVCAGGRCNLPWVIALSSVPNKVLQGVYSDSD